MKYGAWSLPSGMAVIATGGSEGRLRANLGAWVSGTLGTQEVILATAAAKQ
jgi:hypothetical protein